MSASRQPSAPLWFTIVDSVAALPVFQLPALLDNCRPDTDVRTWVMLYPLYVIVAAWIAWRSYNLRPVLAWILIVLMVLTHAAIWYLVLTPVNP